MDTIQLPAGDDRVREWRERGPELPGHPVRDIAETWGSLRDLCLLYIRRRSPGDQSLARERRDKVNQNKQRESSGLV